MENRLEKNMNKWEEENKLLETIRENLTRYSALKDEKGDKDDIDRCNAKIGDYKEKLDTIKEHK